MHVGQHRQVELLAHALEDAQALLQAQAAKAAERAAVRFVERGLEHERYRKLGRDGFEPLGRGQHERLALDHAGAGDQEQWLARADRKAGQLHALAARGNLSPWQDRPR